MSHVNGIVALYWGSVNTERLGRREQVIPPNKPINDTSSMVNTPGLLPGQGREQLWQWVSDCFTGVAVEGQTGR